MRAELIQDAGTTDFKEMLTQVRGIRAAARWMIKTGWLGQFSLAKEQLARSRLPLGADKEVKPKEKRRPRKPRLREPQPPTASLRA